MTDRMEYYKKIQQIELSIRNSELFRLERQQELNSLIDCNANPRVTDALKNTHFQTGHADLRNLSGVDSVGVYLTGNASKHYQKERVFANSFPSDAGISVNKSQLDCYQHTGSIRTEMKEYQSHNTFPRTLHHSPNCRNNISVPSYGKSAFSYNVEHSHKQLRERMLNLVQESEQFCKASTKIRTNQETQTESTFCGNMWQHRALLVAEKSTMVPEKDAADSDSLYPINAWKNMATSMSNDNQHGGRCNFCFHCIQACHQPTPICNSQDNHDKSGLSVQQRPIKLKDVDGNKNYSTLVPSPTVISDQFHHAASGSQGSVNAHLSDSSRDNNRVVDVVYEHVQARSRDQRLYQHTKITDTSPHVQANIEETVETNHKHELIEIHNINGGEEYINPELDVSVQSENAVNSESSSASEIAPDSEGVHEGEQEYVGLEIDEFEDYEDFLKSKGLNPDTGDVNYKPADEGGEVGANQEPLDEGNHHSPAPLQHPPSHDQLLHYLLVLFKAVENKTRKGLQNYTPYYECSGGSIEDVEDLVSTLNSGSAGGKTTSLRRLCVGVSTVLRLILSTLDGESLVTPSLLISHHLHNEQAVREALKNQPENLAVFDLVFKHILFLFLHISLDADELATNCAPLLMPSNARDEQIRACKIFLLNLLQPYVAEPEDRSSDSHTSDSISRHIRAATAAAAAAAGTTATKKNNVQSQLDDNAEIRSDDGDEDEEDDYDGDEGSFSVNSSIADSLADDLYGKRDENEENGRREAQVEPAAPGEKGIAVELEEYKPPVKPLPINFTKSTEPGKSQQAKIFTYPTSSPGGQVITSKAAGFERDMKVVGGGQSRAVGKKPVWLASALDSSEGEDEIEGLLHPANADHTRKMSASSGKSLERNAEANEFDDEF